jgi:Zn-dependent protease with chaperone function
VSLSRALRILAALVVAPLIVGCAGVSYRERAEVSQTRYASLENFSDEAISAEQIDGLLEEVAALLDVTLSPEKPKVRIMVTTPTRIADVYRSMSTVAPHGADAVALYFPGASLVLISSYDRRILGHELAHYVTDHYLKSAPRSRWERIAYDVEDRLPLRSPNVARTPAGGTLVAARVAPPVGPPTAEAGD